MTRLNHAGERAATPQEITTRPNPSHMHRVAQAQENALAPGTRLLYYKHWKSFADWCFDNGYRALPADEDTISLYLTIRADTGTKVATLGPILSAIRHYHEAVELTSPTTNPRVSKTLKGLAREYPRRPAQVAALDQDAFDTILEKADIPKDSETPHQTAKRAAFDKALVAFSRDILARPETTAAAEWHHIEETQDGKFVLFIPHSKTDQTHEGVYGYLTEDTILLLDEMFANKKRGRKPTDKIFGISERQIANRIQAAATHAGLNARFRGQSARIGMAIDLAMEGFDMAALKQAGRWVSDRTVSRYIERVPPTRNPVAVREARNSNDLYDDEDLGT